MIAGAAYDPAVVDVSVLEEYSAHRLAGKLAGVLDAVSATSSSFADGERRAAYQ
jgi:hypothetical protein